MEIRELECGEYILLNHGKVIRRGTYELCLEIQLEYECIYAWANEMSNNTKPYNCSMEYSKWR